MTDSGTRSARLPHLHVCSHSSSVRVNRGAGGHAEEKTDSGTTIGSTAGVDYMDLFSKNPLRIRDFEGQSTGLPTQRSCVNEGQCGRRG